MLTEVQSYVECSIAFAGRPTTTALWDVRDFKQQIGLPHRMRDAAHTLTA